MALQLAAFMSGGSSSLRVFDLVINSEDRVNYLTTTTTNFRVNLQNPINQRIVGYGLKSAVIPRSLYNIPVIRNTFTFFDGVANYTVTVPAGNYTMTELLTQIQTLLNALGPNTFTLTYSNLSGKTTWATTGPPMIINPTLDTSQGSILYKLGFLPGVAYTGVNITSPNVADITGIKTAFIKIKQLTQYIRNTTNSMMNFKVDLDGQFGDIIFYADENKYHQYFNIAQDHLTNQGFYDVTLVDEYGIPIDLNGRDWSFVIQFITADSY